MGKKVASSLDESDLGDLIHIYNDLGGKGPAPPASEVTTVSDEDEKLEEEPGLLCA